MNPAKDTIYNTAVQRRMNMKDTQAKAYCEYLKTRSRVSKFYRRWYLYPLLGRHLSGKTLDVGCGIGDFLAVDPRNRCGVDINPYLVDYCRQIGLDAYVIDGVTLPFDDAFFSGLVMSNVLEHLSQPEPLLAECRRVLPQGGTMIIGVPGKKGYTTDPTHEIYYDEPYLRKRVSQFGFSHVQTLYSPFRFSLLTLVMKQYAIYGVFKKN